MAYKIQTDCTGEILFVILLAFVFFAGEPDLVDALIYYLMK